MNFEIFPRRFRIMGFAVAALFVAMLASTGCSLLTKEKTADKTEGNTGGGKKKGGRVGGDVRR